MHIHSVCFAEVNYLISVFQLATSKIPWVLSQWLDLLLTVQEKCTALKENSRLFQHIAPLFRRDIKVSRCWQLFHTTLWPKNRASGWNMPECAFNICYLTVHLHPELAYQSCKRAFAAQKRAAKYLFALVALQWLSNGYEYPLGYLKQIEGVYNTSANVSAHPRLKGYRIDLWMFSALLRLKRTQKKILNSSYPQYNTIGTTLVCIIRDMCSHFVDAEGKMSLLSIQC